MIPIILADPFFHNENKIESELRIFPNPFQNKINIDAENILVFSVKIFSCLGELVGNFKINGKNNFSLVFGDNLSPGIYLLKVHTDKKVLLKRLVKT